MVICCIGDSLTEGDYGIPNTRCVANVHEKGYPWFLRELSGAEVRNYGRCGWRSSDMYALARAGGLLVKDADIIILMLGTNGGQKPDTDTPDNEAYLQLIALLHREAPNAKLYLCTPPHVTVNPAMSNCGYAPQVADAVAFVRQTAKKLALPLIDLAADPHFTDETEAVYQPNDGLHFGEEGYKMLAQVIWQGIRA